MLVPQEHAESQNKLQVLETQENQNLENQDAESILETAAEKLESQDTLPVSEMPETQDELPKNSPLLVKDEWPENPQSSRVVVKWLPEDFYLKHLRVFKQFGGIFFQQIATTDDGKKFACISFNFPDQAQKALNLKEISHGNGKISVGVSLAGQKPARRICLRDLPPELTRMEIQQAFPNQEQIEISRISNRAYIYFEFSTEALEALHVKEIGSFSVVPCLAPNKRPNYMKKRKRKTKNKREVKNRRHEHQEMRRERWKNHERYFDPWTPARYYGEKDYWYSPQDRYYNHDFESPQYYDDFEN